MPTDFKLDRLMSDPRVTVRATGAPDGDGDCVVYWMQRAQRANGNPALETAIRAANLLEKPVVVYFQVIADVVAANLRHYTFLVEGLEDVAAELERRDVPFVLQRHPAGGFLEFCRQVRPALVVADENPLREPERNRARVAKALPVPFWTVDADVIVPSRLLEKEQYAARTIRPRIHARLDEFLVPIRRQNPNHRWKKPRGVTSLRADGTLLEGLPIDRSVGPVSTFKGGSREAQRRLRAFVKNALPSYAEGRNKPERDATSKLSPYLHFGHIGPHTIALAVREADAPRKDREAFLEELIVRRELSVNFVRFNKHYDSLRGAESWALETLADHEDDPRRFEYSFDDLENAETHDPLWNAAQRQMVSGGWMHGYLRMYWAKKILEWSPRAAEAFDVAVELNDRYELDGRDPNGYTGIAWAIGGKHDRAWGPERKVFGKVRYMSFESTSRKFDSEMYRKRVSQQAEKEEGGS